MKATLLARGADSSIILKLDKETANNLFGYLSPTLVKEGDDIPFNYAFEHAHSHMKELTELRSSIRTLLKAVEPITIVKPEGSSD